MSLSFWDHVYLARVGLGNSDAEARESADRADIARRAREAGPPSRNVEADRPWGSYRISSASKAEWVRLTALRREHNYLARLEGTAWCRCEACGAAMTSLGELNEKIKAEMSALAAVRAPRGGPRKAAVE